MQKKYIVRLSDDERGAIHADILDYSARVLATLALLGRAVWRSRLTFGLGFLEQARLCDILATYPAAFSERNSSAMCNESGG